MNNGNGERKKLYFRKSKEEKIKNKTENLFLCERNYKMKKILMKNEFIAVE